MGLEFLFVILLGDNSEVPIRVTGVSTQQAGEYAIIMFLRRNRMLTEMVSVGPVHGKRPDRVRHHLNTQGRDID